MSQSELQEISQSDPDLRDHWLAIDPRGGQGLVALRSGAVIVDCDRELDALCQRLVDEEKTSLTIVYCGPPLSS
jgi:hypothetical protein